ncbi:MAG: hypothetical protein V3V01_10415 [Acidimicrobiales bacterium]
MSGLALAALGSLVIHQIAYLLAYPVLQPGGDELIDHSHMATQWAVVTPVAIVMAAVVVLRQARQLGLANPLHTTALASSAAFLFVGQEVIESLLAGRSLLGALSQPAIGFGLLIAPAVAWFIVRLLRSASIFVAEFIAITARFAVATTPLFAPVGQWLTPSSPLPSASSPRGPPVHFA